LAAASAWEEERRAKGLAAPRVNAALTSGRVLFAVIGEDERLEYTVIGEAVNLAAKLEKHNKVLKTRALADARTCALASCQGYAGADAWRALPATELPDAGGRNDLVVLAG